MTLGRSEIAGLLDRHGIGLRQSLGQNFVVDPNTVRRIVGLAGAGPGDHVLEVGAGVGNLTVALADAGATVTAVEIDHRLLPALAETTAGRPVTVVCADATVVDVGSFGAELFVSNLPYNVGSTILLRVLAEAPSVRSGLVMVQREVADRLCATPGTRTWGIPSVKARWFATVRRVGTVPASVFLPPPKVQSALVAFERRLEPDADRQRAFALIDAGFAQRRKTLRRSLAAISSPAELERAGVDPGRRAETLTVAEWAALARA